MSNQLSIQASPPRLGSGEVAAPSRSSAAQSPVQTPAAKPIQLFANPIYKFDPTVGLVVMQFLDSTGDVTNTIPSARQLGAYRTHQATPPGEQTPRPPQTTVQAVDAKTTAG